MSLSVTLKREAAAQGYAMVIRNATGMDPIIQRTTQYTYIKWRPGQDKLMVDYLMDLTKPSSQYNPNDLNVDLELKPVLLPFLFKKYWTWLAGTILISGLAGFTMAKVR